MAETEPISPGILKSLRSILARLIATCRTRAELFVVEFQEERYRLIELFLMAGAALMLATLALLVLSIALILVFPPAGRIYAALGLVLIYGAAAILLVMRIKRRMRGEPFSETINQLKKDWECLTPPE